MPDWKKAYDARERELQKRWWMEGMALRDLQRREQKKIRPETQSENENSARGRSKNSSALALVLLIGVGYLLFRAANPALQQSSHDAESTPPVGGIASSPIPNEPAASASKTPESSVPAPSTDPERPTADQKTPSDTPTSIAAAEMTFPVTHKHRLRDCRGVLTLSKASIRYQTDNVEDSFEFSIGDVSLHDDGIEVDGKRWHFEIDGQRPEDLFREWKAGRLLP